MQLEEALQLGIQTGQWQPAVDELSRLAVLNPGNPDLLSNLGYALHRTGNLPSAIACLEQALRIDPNSVNILTNLGNALADQQQYDHALDCLHRAVAFAPDDADCHCNLGVALGKTGLVEAAIASYERALALRPVDPMTRMNYAIALLQIGDLPRGFHEYESRYDFPQSPFLRPELTQPIWDGGDATGKTILIHAEQGFGDSIQFSRYVSFVQARGAKVIFECHPDMTRLLAGIEGAEQVISFGEALPRYDFHCPLLSLPRIFGTTLSTIPSHVPYLHIKPALIERWRQRLASNPSRLKVGLAWAGSAATPALRPRDIPLSLLTPLSQFPDIAFYSLQLGLSSQETRTLPAHFSLTDVTNQLYDFVETAALISNLDLVISVDTAVAHLAGALGKPTWTLLNFVPDWRWLLGRSDTPWYPTMKLFRQRRPGDWLSAVDQLEQAMKELVAL